MTIAFTGATGNLAAHLVEELLERTSASRLVALARDPDKASAIASRGVEVRRFDYDEPGDLADALAGVERLLLISGSEVGKRVAQHEAVIDAAAAAGVGFVGYTSFLHVDRASRIAVAPDHQATEKALEAAPFRVALLRNGWYTDNFEGRAREALAQGELVGSTGRGRISSAPRRDYAAGIAAVLTAETAQAGTYELGGDESWSLADLAAALSEASGTTVAHRDVSGAEHRQFLIDGGAPEPLADFLVGTDAAIAAGELEDPTPGTLSGLIGRPTTPLRELVATWV
ncbi:MAG TPA: NAD(P)H-binding protein [Actinomycetaceae bacterium]|nr:NAD(P)H-binding protein [Actinomycetaceae bacterium]